MAAHESEDLIALSKKLCAQSDVMVATMQILLRESIELRRRSAVLIRASRAFDDGIILKRCACGKAYTITSWLAAKHAGWQDSEAMSGELRHCVCKSTLLLVTRR